jgi:hypothetical protein
MNPKTLKLLKAADDPVQVEFPKGFDWKRDWPRLVERVKAVIPDVEKILGRNLVLDTGPQDATFFADLSLPYQHDSKYTVIALRFSYFGNLFTTWSVCQSESIPRSKVKKIIAAVERHGFIYVDKNDLNEPYSGANPKFMRTPWWFRFFDYF